MQIFIATFIFMLLAVTGLAAGLILRGRELKGSCGGLNNIDGAECGICGAKTPCDEADAGQKAR